jgi:probable phosphoglycerate mutase
MPATTLVLVRHGETDWNRDGRIQGQTDVPLNERGRDQARQLADTLAGSRFDAVYASNLARARETAEIVAARVGLPVIVDEDLRELDFGAWEGLTGDEIRARWPEAFERWASVGLERYDGGESHEQLSTRVLAATRRLAAIHQGGEILLVAHGGPLRAILMEAEGLDYRTERRTFRRIANCEASRVAVEDGRLRSLD